MTHLAESPLAIVDYGLGNLFSVQHACAAAGIRAVVTSSKRDILEADAVILPGVGAYGDAMASLRRMDLVQPLREVAASSKPFIGICLGLQLLMTESYEFGTHRGLGLVEGPVVRLETPAGKSGRLKVPQIGWNRIWKVEQSWSPTLLKNMRNGEFMYFVHSFYAKPENPEAVLSLSRYGDIEFCSSIRYRNIFAFQFHPERSGLPGLVLYRNLARLIRQPALTSSEQEVGHA